MKLLKAIIITVSVFICVFEVYSLGSREAVDSVQVFSGEVSYLEGTVHINGSIADTGYSVKNGDVIETDRDSFCEIVFNERNIIQIGPESFFRVEKSSNIDFTLQKGSLSAVADKLDKFTMKGDKVAVKTPSAVMGVRGTLFFIKVENENSSYLCVCNGEANTYRGSGERRRNVKADHHKAVRYIRSGDSYKTESPGLLYHDDESMEILAAKIGVEVDWGSGNAYE